MGHLSEDHRRFTKAEYDGLLSVITERTVRTRGAPRYLLKFNQGSLSSADGVGFVFSPKLPCVKNIQKIISIFLNQRGRICMRVRQDVVRSPVSLSPLRLGDVVDLTVDLEEQVAHFTAWPHDSTPPSSASFAFGAVMRRFPQLDQSTMLCGHFACVVKNAGVAVELM